MTIPESVELKPCPFCGSNEIEVDCYMRDDAGVCIEPAANCNGCGGIFIFDFKGKEPWPEITRRWNTRAAHTSHNAVELVEALKPLADFANLTSASCLPNDHVITLSSGMAARQLTMGDCRKARAALSKVQQ
jgi:hypothetical protein